MMTAKTEILEIVREMALPITASEVRELCPHLYKQTVYSTLSWLEMNGDIASETVTSVKTKRPVKQYIIGNGKSKSLKPIKLKAPTEAGIGVDLALARDLISELQAWKTDAIARFPDLAVEPVVLTARKLVANEARKAGDNHSASEIMAGKRDGVLAMKAVIAALEGVGK